MADSFNVFAAPITGDDALSTFGVAGFGAIIGDSSAPYALITTANRNIGGIIANCWVEELHKDEMMITQHPVETGAPITDHAFLQPVSVEIHAKWSDSSAQAIGYVQEVYQQFQALQQSAQPFNVTTGKRDYGTMLLRSLVVMTRNVESEYALDLRATCQHIIITGSGGTGATSSFNGGYTTINVPPGTLGADDDLLSWANQGATGGTVALQIAPSGIQSLESLLSGQWDY